MAISLFDFGCDQTNIKKSGPPPENLPAGSIEGPEAAQKIIQFSKEIGLFVDQELFTEEGGDERKISFSQYGGHPANGFDSIGAWRNGPTYTTIGFFDKGNPKVNINVIAKNLALDIYKKKPQIKIIGGYLLVVSEPYYMYVKGEEFPESITIKGNSYDSYYVAVGTRVLPSSREDALSRFETTLSGISAARVSQ